MLPSTSSTSSQTSSSHQTLLKFFLLTLALTQGVQSKRVVIPIHNPAPAPAPVPAPNPIVILPCGQGLIETPPGSKICLRAMGRFNYVSTNNKAEKNMISGCPSELACLAFCTGQNPPEHTNYPGLSWDSENGNCLCFPDFATMQKQGNLIFPTDITTSTYVTSFEGTCETFPGMTKKIKAFCANYWYYPNGGQYYPNPATSP